MVWRLRREIPSAWAWCLVDRRGLSSTETWTRAIFSGVTIWRTRLGIFGATLPSSRGSLTYFKIDRWLGTTARGGSPNRVRVARCVATIESLFRKNVSTANEWCWILHYAIATKLPATYYTMRRLAILCNFPSQSYAYLKCGCLAPPPCI